jgi:hypothetical protein
VTIRPADPAEPGEGRSCLSKVRFRTRDQALAAAQRYASSTWRAYYCHYCYGFHLTTKPLRRPNDP